MYVLGSMIRLPIGESRIPVPWWHRAVLGLQHGTRVYVGVTEHSRDRPGELLVSVLNLSHWNDHVVLRREAPDAPGVIEGVLKDALPWNVALAETATVDGGEKHRVDLICETYRGRPPTGGDARPPNGEEISAARGAYPLPPLAGRLAWHRLGTVEHGWVCVATHGPRHGWRDVVTTQLASLTAAEGFDQEKLVLSADTEARLFRVLVPRRGVVLASIRHADEPGVLRTLAASLRDAGVNILSSLLKRGGVAPEDAIFEAVCEPDGSRHSSTPLGQRICAAMERLPQNLRIDVKNVEAGVAPESVVYSRHPEDIVAQVPSHLRARVQELRARNGRRSVFLSRRFHHASKQQAYAQKIQDVLKSLGWTTIEAAPGAGGMRTSLDEVSAAMWAAHAGIVLGVEPDSGSDVAFSLNLAHEFGFMQGQAKPLLLLIEAESRVGKELDAWTNVKGITAPRFHPQHAHHDAHPQSLRTAVVKWLLSLESLP